LPKHVHIEKAENVAKFNIDIVTVVYSYGFSASELKEIRKVVEANKEQFIIKWDEFFSSK
jgi:hypothetical protein